MLDAYTVRKAIPRIVLAVIGINLSIYLCIAVIDIVNIIGHGLGNLMTTPFLDKSAYGDNAVKNNVSNNIAGITGIFVLLGVTAGAGLATVGAITGATTGIFAAAAAVAGGIGIALIAVLVPIIISVALILMAILFTLVIRQALIIFLVVVSPVAIALFVLPGTEKYFKKWLDLFIKTLMVYPIISVIFAMSTIMATVLLGTAPLDAGAIGLTKVLASVVVVFAPLVMIPFAFKLAGGAIAAVMNAANGRTANLSGRAKQGIQKWRQDPNSWAGKKTSTNKANRIGTGATAGQVLSGLTGGLRRDGTGFRGGYRGSSGAITREERLRRIGEIGKHESVQAIANNENFLEAARQFRTEEEQFNYLTSAQGGGYDIATARQGVTSIRRAKAVTSHEEFAIYATAQLPTTGTSFSTGGGEMLQAINEAAGDDRVLAGNMLGIMRPLAMQARRPDLAGMGFGDQVNALNDLHAAGNTDVVAQAMTRDLDARAIMGQGGAQIASARLNSVRRLAPVMREELQTAIDSGNQDEVDRRLAQIAGIYDAMGAIAPENAEAFSDLVVGTGVTVSVGGNPTQTTVRQMMSEAEMRAPNPQGGQTFLEMRKSFANAGIAAHAAAGAAAAAVAAAGAAGGAAAGGIPPAPSDRRLKKEITYIETVDGDIKLYKFKYIWSEQIYVGVIAQEILETHLEAVVKDVFGFYSVNYDLLGIEFQTIEEWKKQKTIILK